MHYGLVHFSDTQCLHGIFLALRPVNDTFDLSYFDLAHNLNGIYN